MGAEAGRLASDARREGNWKRWGPYLAERQWGTVREDYSGDGSVWDYFSHDQSRSRTYRWGEDGLLGITDRQCRLCFALALWNGRDPILKERLFGLTGPEGNHGEDVKELYYYLDSTPTHSYLKGLYKYPQAEFPYEPLVRVNRERSKTEPEYELLDTGVFDDGRYFDVIAEYAKADEEDILIRITVANRGPEPATLDVLPTVWFRNTWSWGRSGEGYWPKPSLRRLAGGGAAIAAEHAGLGRYVLEADTASDGLPALLFTENETNASRLFGAPNPQPYVKDAFHRAIVNGESAAINPAEEGTKAAFHYRLVVPAGGERDGSPPAPRGAAFRRIGIRSRVRQRVRGPDLRGRRVLRGARARRPPPKTSGACSVRGMPGCCGASSSTTTCSAIGSRATRRSRRRRRVGWQAATPSGRMSTTATSSRCPTSGSIRGSPPGTWRST